MSEPGEEIPAERTDVFPAALRLPRTTAVSTSPAVVAGKRALRRTQAAARRDRVLSLILGSILVVVLVTTLVTFSTLTWTGRHQSATAISLLNIRIIGGVVPVLIYSLGVLAFVFLLVRRPSRRWIVASASGIAVGVIGALLVLWFVSATNALGVQLSDTSSAWAIVAFGGVGFALGSFWGASWLRRIASAISIVVAIAVATVGINADFGLDPTVGDLAGISTQKTLAIPLVKSTPTPVPTTLAGGALWANWHAPAGMPASGTTGQVVIPNTVSGFKARPAGLYLPPAAQVAHPPALPLLIMMMGQPGNPDPSFTAPILNAFAARHHGLAPIVLVADQIGNPAVDPLCLDTAAHGKAETYLVQDVAGWARTHLHVLQDAAHWTIAGYSNGGECALSLGAKFPAIWGNVLDISGEQYPGSDRPAQTLAAVFHGNVAAYRATWPLGILARGQYPDSVGIFTVGSNDYQYRKEALAVNSAAIEAKWKTTYFEVPNGGHVLAALNGGLTEGYTVLYPRLGLSNPSTNP